MQHTEGALMEHLERIAIAVSVFAITSILAYLFKMRQLYSATPTLYKTTPISGTGSLYELYIYNRGNAVEENVTAEIDPNLRCELLASNMSNLELRESRISIDRLHKGREASALLLIENGKFSASSIISLSSSHATGKTFERKEDVPDNYAKLFLYIVILIGIIPAFSFAVTIAGSIEQRYIENKLDEIYKLGWSNLGEYYDSDLKVSYSNQEFPVRFRSLSLEKDGQYLNFDVFNKSAIPLEVFADKEVREDGDYRYVSKTEIDPMNKASIKIRWDSTSDSPTYTFSFGHGGENIWDIVYTPDPTSLQVDP